VKAGIVSSKTIAENGGNLSARHHLEPKNVVGRSYLDSLRRRGFDRSTYNPSGHSWSVRCSQCEALVINGLPSHEFGCPNRPRS
jgi:hypothetical protein